VSVKLTHRTFCGFFSRRDDAKNVSIRENVATNTGLSINFAAHDYISPRVHLTIPSSKTGHESIFSY